jgi:hypothetical protein
MKKSATIVQRSASMKLALVLAAGTALSGCMEARMLSSDESYGVVTTFTADVPEKIYPAYISVIDGRSVQTTGSVGGIAGQDPRTFLKTRKHTFRLPPGEHTLRIVADLSDATGVLRMTEGYTPRGEQPGEIKLFVEEGRQYYVGARLTGTRKNEWEPVVWAVKDVENYEHGIGH